MEIAGEKDRPCMRNEKLQEKKIEIEYCIMTWKLHHEKTLKIVFYEKVLKMHEVMMEMQTNQYVIYVL